MTQTFLATPLHLGNNPRVSPAAWLHRLLVGAVIMSMLAVGSAPAWHSHQTETAHAETFHAKTANAKVEQLDGHSHCACDHHAPSNDGHGHHDNQERHDCPLCVAIDAPTGMGRIPALVVLALRRSPDRVRLPPENEPTLRLLPVLWPCGPPSLCA